MATEDIDIAQLSEDQQLALQQFTSVTDQNLADAIPILRKCEWNVQIAIARFFDGEPIEPSNDTLPDIPPPQSSRRTETLMNGFSDEFIRSRNTLEPAPRVVSQPDNQAGQQTPLILSLLFTPVNVIYGLFSRIFGILSYAFPFLPRLVARLTSRATNAQSRSNAGGRRPLGPQDTTARFLREFEEEYGSHALPFSETGYARAFDIAKQDLKFLLAIPLSPEHDDTASFIRNTLLSEPVVTFLHDPTNNILLWAGSVQDSEPYQVATALNITKFPSAALIVHTPSVSSTAMSVVARISGPVAPEEFLAKVQAAIRQHSEALRGVRATRAEQQASRNLRDQQNSAYERSLATDRERARQRREAEAVKEKQEREQRERQEASDRYARDLEQWRIWRVQTLLEEPGPAEKDAVRISVRLSNGERVVRKFKPDASIEEVYAFVECHDLIRLSQEHGPSEKEIEKPAGFVYKCEFRLVSPMPREVYDLSKGGTVRENIGRSGNLIVERIEPEEEDTEAAVSESS